VCIHGYTNTATPQESVLHLKESVLHLKESVLHLKESVLHLKESVLHLKALPLERVYRTHTHTYV